MQNNNGVSIQTKAQIDIAVKREVEVQLQESMKFFIDEFVKDVKAALP